MSAEKLIDLAIARCDPPNGTALGVRVGVSRQLVSDWRRGVAPMADERVTAVCQVAGVDPAVWLPAVRAGQTTGDVSRAWLAAARRLGFAASLLAVGVASWAPAPSYAASGHVLGAGLYIMRSRRRAGVKDCRRRRYRSRPLYCRAA
jgi:hypothetical protein